MIFSANCNYTRSFIPAAFLNNLSAKKKVSKGARKLKLWKEQERGTCWFLFNSFQLLSLSFLDLYESQIVFSWKSVPRYNYLKLACHPPEADGTRLLCPLTSHGISDKCGGTCRRCHTSLSLPVPPLPFHGDSSKESWSLITTVLRTFPGRYSLGRSVRYWRLLMVHLNLTPKGSV